VEFIQIEGIRNDGTDLALSVFMALKVDQKAWCSPAWYSESFEFELVTGKPNISLLIGHFCCIDFVLNNELNFLHVVWNW
jgi:hypothetical protein